MHEAETMLQVAGYDTVPCKVLGKFHLYARLGCPIYLALRIDTGAIETSDVRDAITQLFPELAAQEELARA